MIDLWIIRHHQRNAALFNESPDNGFIGTFQNLADNTLFSTAPVNANYAGKHPVAIHHGAHLTWGEVHIFGAFVRNDKTKTITVCTDPATDQIHPGRQAVSITPVLDQLPVPHHGAKAAAQDFTRIVRVYFQCGSDILSLQRASMRFHQ